MQPKVALAILSVTLCDVTFVGLWYAALTVLPSPSHELIGVCLLFALNGCAALLERLVDTWSVEATKNQAHFENGSKVVLRGVASRGATGDYDDTGNPLLSDEQV